MMKRIALAATFVYLTVAPAFAADNAIILTPGVGVTERSKDVGGGVQSVIVIPGDTSGNPLATAPGTGNTVFALPMQGVAGGVAVPVSGTFWQATQPVSGTFWPYALGQQVSGSSVPVVLPAAQITTLTPPAWSNSNQIGNTGFNATLQATPTTAIGKVDPNTIATWGLAALGGATAPTNAVATACEYLTSAPTYTTGQTGAIQCTAAGSVHVTVDNTPAVTQSGPWNFGGAAGSPVTMQSAAVANGNGTTLTVMNYNTALINVNCSVACSGGTTINFEGTDSTGTYFSVQATPVAGTGASVNSATTSGQFCVNVIAYTTLRARISAYSAGTITVTGTPAFGGPCPVDVVNTNTNGQQTMANSSPVTLASNQSVADICTFAAKKFAPISTSSGNAQIVAPSGSTKVYICSIVTVGATASVQNIIEGTGAACTTANEAAIIGSTTAANGMSFAANGGFSYGNGGAEVGATATAGNGVCLLQSGTAAIAGIMGYVQQ